MEVLITGANGFVGKNLRAALMKQEEIKVLTYDLNTSEDLLTEYCKNCEFVFHFAGVNRTNNPEDYYTGNYEFTKKLTDILIERGNTCPILYTSSVHAILDNPYGRSKAACEELLKAYEETYQVTTYTYRLPNLFGKWCKPNYNSVIATFCYNISKNIPITISDPGIIIKFAYIDDVVKEFISALSHKGYKGTDGYYTIPMVHQVSLGQIAKLLYSFQEGYIPKENDSFESKLYATYQSY